MGARLWTQDPLPPLMRRGHTLAFCRVCNRRDALHIDGVCANADRHEPKAEAK